MRGSLFERGETSGQPTTEMVTSVTGDCRHSDRLGNRGIPAELGSGFSMRNVDSMCSRVAAYRCLGSACRLGSLVDGDVSRRRTRPLAEQEFPAEDGLEAPLRRQGPVRLEFPQSACQEGLGRLRSSAARSRRLRVVSSPVGRGGSAGSVLLVRRRWTRFRHHDARELRRLPAPYRVYRSQGKQLGSLQPRTLRDPGLRQLRQAEARLARLWRTLRAGVSRRKPGEAARRVAVVRHHAQGQEALAALERQVGLSTTRTCATARPTARRSSG